MHVEKVTPSENGESVRLLNSNRDIIVTVSKNVYEDYQNIKEGDRIMAWYQYHDHEPARSDQCYQGNCITLNNTVSMGKRVH